ncbi:hypothetical protein OIU76_015911 [Salix suchowensis]|nr:hypothetical protein OIU76_015911 [Salix suchowensis]
MANPVTAEDGRSQRHRWLDGIRIKIGHLSPLSNWSIWKVPHSLRSVNDDAYNPHVISIGPLFRGELKLQSMESLPSLPELALGFFKSTLYMNNANFRIIRRPYPHLLDLIHNCYLPAATAVRNNSREWVSTQPATSLDAAGIVFRRGPTRNLFDLRFRNGVLEIPPLHIHDSTVSLFQNLIAYEQLSRGNPQYITSYFALMSRLVYDRRDAELLESRGIIENEMSGGWKDVSVLFNDMRKQVVVQDFYYAELCQRLNSNFRTQWAEYKATLRKTYFRSPWAFLSITAACVLLILTATQTIYAVLSYSPRT